MSDVCIPLSFATEHKKLTIEQQKKCKHWNNSKILKQSAVPSIPGKPGRPSLPLGPGKPEAPGKPGKPGSPRGPDKPIQQITRSRTNA